MMSEPLCPLISQALYARRSLHLACSLQMGCQASSGRYPSATLDESAQHHSLGVINSTENAVALSSVRGRDWCISRHDVYDKRGRDNTQPLPSSVSYRWSAFTSARRASSRHGAGDHRPGHHDLHSLHCGRAAHRPHPIAEYDHPEACHSGF